MNAKRTLEILPGALTWTALVVPLILSFFYPKVVMIYVLIYALYWLIKTVIMSGHLILGYRDYRKATAIDWLEKNKSLMPLKKYEDIYHALILATYKEELVILERSLNAVINSNYDLKKVIFILAGEEQDQENFLANARILKQKFGKYFYLFIATLHPKDIVGEVKGKGANITFAAKELKKIIDQKKLAYENIVVTTLDADNCPDRQYLACLTYHYLIDPDPHHKSFQPIPMYFNNIWEVPFITRMIALGSSFWQIVESTRPSRLRNFSSHAQSFAALVQTDFWSTTTIVEDGHQYWRSYFIFQGQHFVVPIFVPIYQDAVSGETFFQTMKEQYLQKRRWAWGCSDIPYAIIHTWQDHRLPRWSKWVNVFRLIDGHFSWATTSLTLALVGWSPILFGQKIFAESVFYNNFHLFYSRILSSAMIGMLVTLTISTLLLPPTPKRIKHRFLKIAWEWILAPVFLPLSNIFLGALPAIDSQTRLMLGKYLGFRVTVKTIAK